MNVSSCTDFDRVYLAFDIHEVLAQESATKIEASLFQANGMLLKVPMGEHSRPMRHYVYPHVKELFQLLEKTQGMHYAFYTSSPEWFAKPFVKELLINSLGEEAYAAIAEKVRVYTKEQFRPKSSYEKNLRSRHSETGNQCKDLDDAFPSLEIPKKQRVLIDDDVSFAAPHQAKNILKVSGMSWTERFSNYQSYGYSLYYFMENENWRKIKPGESFALIKMEDVEPAFKIMYHEKESVKMLALSLEESLKIQELYEKAVLEGRTMVHGEYSHGANEKAIVDEIKTIALEKGANFKKNIIINGEGVSKESCLQSVVNGNIVMHLKEGDADIYFLENPRDAISLKDHGALALIKLAREHWELKCRNLNYFSKSSYAEPAHKELYAMTWNKIKDLIWKEKIIPEANHILLLTGAIFSAFEESKATQKPITKILFNWQCTGEKEKKKFEHGFIRKRTDLYEKGLELLRTVNPDLDPVTIKSFESSVEQYPELPEDDAAEYRSECIVS